MSGGCIFHPKTHAKYGRLIEPIGFLCPFCIIRLGTIAAAERDARSALNDTLIGIINDLTAERDALRARNKSWEKAMGERVKQANALMDERDALRALVREAAALLDRWRHDEQISEELDDDTTGFLDRLDAAAKADR